MKSIIYNYTLGYDTKEELAEYCAIVYGKNIFVDNIFDKLSESQNVNESVLDVADDITDFIFKTCHQPATLKMSRLGSESNLAQSTEADGD